MPATSKKQRTLACIALSIKHGKTSASYSARGAKMAESMSTEDLEHFCKEPIKK